ncbi:MAG: UDP-glucose 4-epimerase [Lasallia pustulata]|uniref:UDP-glucose 4-epimerase n=1 Tax=Lasallia pustulata TaxID=136370 RepID=A0A1W5CTJ3_9LECA|nr:MAG: UDP-glucose 4-epimerase [Lasallia pustulata]SLM34176.1 udp-glucose 4-epimerase [Lasallia pustulata]
MPSATAAPNAARGKRVAGFPIVLVTGGSGYIGSHTVLDILNSGCAVVVIDNLGNSHMEALCRVHYIAQKEYERRGQDPNSVPPLFFHRADLRDRNALTDIFQLWQAPEAQSKRRPVPIDIGLLAKENYRMKEYSMADRKEPVPLPITHDPSSFGKITSVIHFAALKAVGESITKPLEYYENNIAGLINLLQAMAAYNIKNLVFSSSAVVYGTGKEMNISEDSVQVGGKGTGAGLVTNPYGRSKWMAEEILNDCCFADPDFMAISLRYFNPTGSHPSGLIGEDPKGTPNNIVPVILQAYQRRRSKVYVFGSNYDTTDGTGVRDYIHVGDLASGHVAALRKLQPGDISRPSISSAISDASRIREPEPNYRVYNLGTGQGYSVLDIIKAFSAVCGSEIPFAISDARPGDLGTVTADASKAETELDWHAAFGLQDMCRDVYNWAAENPAGYERLRKLSAIALKDPMAVRKASIDAGLLDTKSAPNLNELLTGMANVVTRKSSFSGMVRKLSTMNLNLESMSTLVEEQEPHDDGAAPPQLTINGQPQWGMFGEGWTTQVGFGQTV